jgi:hypothetical protein
MAREGAPDDESSRAGSSFFSASNANIRRLHLTRFFGEPVPAGIKSEAGLPKNDMAAMRV